MKGDGSSCQIVSLLSLHQGKPQISDRGRWLVLGQEKEEQIKWHSTAPNFVINGTKMLSFQYSSILSFYIFDIWGLTKNNRFPWLLQNKSGAGTLAGTLAGTKFFMLVGRWLAVDFWIQKLSKIWIAYLQIMHRYKSAQKFST